MQTESQHAIAHFLDMLAKASKEEALRGLDIHGPHHSYHEAHSVLREEEDELWEEIKRRNPDHPAIEKEAIQVAAMALRIAVMARRRKRVTQ